MWIYLVIFFPNLSALLRWGRWVYRSFQRCLLPLIWHEGGNSDRLRNSHVFVWKSRYPTKNIPVTRPRFSLFLACSCSIVINVCNKHQFLKSLNSSVRRNWTRHLSFSVESLWLEGEGEDSFFAPPGGSAHLRIERCGLGPGRRHNKLSKAMFVGFRTTLTLWNHNIRDFHAPESLTYKALIF